MVLKEIDQEVKGGVIKLLQLFDSKKLEKIIAALKKSDYTEAKSLRCIIRFDAPCDNEEFQEKIDETPIPRLEQFHFECELSPHEFYFNGNIQELLDEGDYCNAKFFQHRLCNPETEGDIDELMQYIRLALEIPQVRKKVEIKIITSKSTKPQSFQEFLQLGHELEVFEEQLTLNSFGDYMRFKANTMAKRKRNELLDFRIVFREEYYDLMYEGYDCCELEFNLLRGNPQTLLEICCNWSEFPPNQYKTAEEVFTYIRSVTEKYFGLKKKATKTSKKK